MSINFECEFLYTFISILYYFYKSESTFINNSMQCTISVSKLILKYNNLAEFKVFSRVVYGKLNNNNEIK